jgi:hypothetical protein
MYRSAKRILFVLCQLSLLGLPLWAQTFGEITGEVRDSTGAVIPAVSVTIANAATNASRSATTNEAGIYSFSVASARHL